MSNYDGQDPHTPLPSDHQPNDTPEVVTKQPQQQPYPQPQQQPYPQPHQAPYAQPQPYMQPSSQMQSSVSNNNTVVVLNNQSPAVNQPRPWSTGICDCCSDVSVCFCALCCFGLQQSQIASDMGESSCVPCCVPGGMIVLRTKMRIQENIQGSVMDDCCVTEFFPLCSQCQLAREVKHMRMRRC